MGDQVSSSLFRVNESKQSLNKIMLKCSNIEKSLANSNSGDKEVEILMKNLLILKRQVAQLLQIQKSLSQFEHQFKALYA